jgi:D-glycero-D-manno-heptose 1,7-bisphosphate phosphatase
MSMNRALFLDRDGILNERIVDGYVQSPQQLIPLFDLVPLLRHAQQLGWLLIIISNQQGVGKGLMSHDDLHRVNEAFEAAFAQHGVRFHHVEYCTDLASQPSRRRKPEPGMLLDAAILFDVDLQSSWFIGDSLSDAEAGRRAGCKTVLVGEYEASSADVVVHRLDELTPSFLSRQP